MRRFVLLLFMQVFVLQTFAQNLVLLPTKNFTETKAMFQKDYLTVHYHCDKFVIGTASHDLKENQTILLDPQPWQNGSAYYVVFVDNDEKKTEYIKQNRNNFEILFDNENIIIVKVSAERHQYIKPAKNDGLIRIFNNKARLPENNIRFPEISEVDPFVDELLLQISGTNLTTIVRHLQNYGTRNAYVPQSIEAQNWIKGKFEELGLTVEIHDFPMPSGSASDNVIATKLGTKYPNEVVMLGAHYDTYSNSSSQPGADDNASGTAAVLEIARVLSQYSFDRTIVFCAFSGEEYGLYGSKAYAQRCAQEGMDILGYFNLDMIGYLKPSSTVIKTTLIYPQSALELAQFYTNVCSVYLPSFVVEPGTLLGGSSDHESFNNNGYMGIFPFEDVDNHSPYIHTANDTVGLSYNNVPMATTFTKATLASVVTMSNMRFPPKNLVALPSDNVVELFWDYVVDVSCYKVYKNGTLCDSVTTNYFADFDVVNGRTYQYYVTAVFADTNKESGKSNTVTVKPTVPMVPPVVYDFEGGTDGWKFEGEWGLTTTSYHSPSKSLTESPNGNYGNGWNTSATFGPIGLMGYASAQLTFWTKYEIETNYDNVYLEMSTNGAQWDRIEKFTGTQTMWMQKSYSLNDYLNKSVYIRFRFMSDASANKDGIYIDDFEISVTGNGQMQPIKLYSGWNGVSTFLTPINSDVEDITQSITTNLVIIQDEINSYQPSTGINTLENWDTNSGYKIKVSNNTYFRIAGNKIENRSVNLKQGWNIMPVISECNVFCDDFFAYIPSIVVIKEIGSSGVYWSPKNIATLYYLQPGKAYYVFASEDVTINFPDCKGDKIIADFKGTTNYPWGVEKSSGNSHIIGISKEALQDFSVGDKIGVFTTQGKCAGAMAIGSLSFNTALVAFAKDTTDLSSNGFVDGELMNYKIFKSSTNSIHDYWAEYSLEIPDSSRFISEGMSFVTKFNDGGINVQSVEYKVSIYPNPAKEYLFIDLPGENQARIEIISISGQIVHTEFISKKAQIEVSTLPEGIYFLKIMSKNQVIVEKIIVQ